MHMFTTSFSALMLFVKYDCVCAYVQGCARDLSGRDETRDAKVRDRDETETLGILSETRPRPRHSSSRDLGRDVW